ncbi:MAG: hypothetical protein CR984_06950 [Proteobacteria bacterium]|nr:MAG: hypothetical protein CR984_06950 [Pseudomonadota bacterium]
MNSAYSKRAAAALAWLIPAFAILEPVWMLTPFVGFLYGSVMNLSFLEAHDATAWLLLFVLPARGIGMPGLVLTAMGLALFGVGACQVYGAKLFKRGVVIGGVYRWLRHPQYTGLILASLGLVLLWSRFIAYLSLFVMVFLYFLLIRMEEAICRERFGYAYTAYSKRTMGLFPGAGTLGAIAGRSPGIAIPLLFILTLALALGSGWGIIYARKTFSDGAPLFQQTLAWSGLELPVVSPRMPYLNDTGQRRHFRFMMKPAAREDFFQALRSSVRIRNHLMAFRPAGMNAVMILFQPRLSVSEKDGRMSFSFFLAPMQADLGKIGAGLNRFRESARILGLLRIEDMQAGPSVETIKGEIHTVPAEAMDSDPAVRARVTRKVAILLSRF